MVKKKAAKKKKLDSRLRGNDNDSVTLSEGEVAMLLLIGRHQLPMNAVGAGIWAGLQARCRVFAAEKAKEQKKTGFPPARE